MWFRKARRRASCASTVSKHYLTHKEAARELVQERLLHYNQFYNLTWKRVAIRNQRRSWGSCSSLGNLNFSYKILFLPKHLQDYIIVHELCHLAELNHGVGFWKLVAQCAPAYAEHVHELRVIDRVGGNVAYLAALQTTYPRHERPPQLPVSRDASAGV